LLVRLAILVWYLTDEGLDWPLYQSFHGPATLEAQYRHLLHVSNCTDMLCLRGLPAGVLASASQETYSHGYFASPKPHYGYGDYYFGPVVDGKTILGVPSEEFGKGRFSPIPLMVTRDKFEGICVTESGRKVLTSIGYLYSNASLKTEDELARDIKKLFPTGSDDFVRQVLDSYSAKDYQTTFDRREAMIGDLYTNCPTAWLLKASAKKNKGTWKLQFNTGSQIQGASAEYVYDPGFERKSFPDIYPHVSKISQNEQAQISNLPAT
jgi:carboxylesterase type B